MRVVTAHAGHAVAARSLAFAGTQLLDFADAAAGSVCSEINEIGYIVFDPISWFIVGDRMPKMLHPGIAFQVATDANGIAPVRIQLAQAQQRSLALAEDMILGFSVTLLACNAAMQER